MKQEAERIEDDLERNASILMKAGFTVSKYVFGESAFPRGMLLATTLTDDRALISYRKI